MTTHLFNIALAFVIFCVALPPPQSLRLVGLVILWEFCTPVRRFGYDMQLLAAYLVLGELFYWMATTWRIKLRVT